MKSNKSNSNVVCPYCNKKIVKEDLDDFKCTGCKISFKVKVKYELND